MNTDGSKFIRLANLSIIHPFGVTLDYAKSTVYWLDNYLEYIHALDYEALDKRRTVASGHHLKSLNYLSLFEKHLYATDHYQNTILRISKSNGSSIKSFVNKDYVRAYSIRVFHRQRQPNGTICHCVDRFLFIHIVSFIVDHPCTVNNGGCEHLCLVSFLEKDKGIAKCVCREGFKLVDGKNCSLALSYPFLLFGKTHPGTIMGIPLNQPDAGYQTIKPIRNLQRPTSIAFLVETSEIYFVDAGNFTIQKQKLNSDSKHRVIDSGERNLYLFNIVSTDNQLQYL